MEDILAQYGDLSSIKFDPFVPEKLRKAYTTLPPTFPTTPSPFDYFALFFTPELFDIIAKHTNEYAAEKRLQADPEARKWELLSPDEFKVFLGIIIYMGIHKEPQTSQYWNSDFNKGPLHPISSNISLTRWEQIKRYLHISSPSKDKTSGYHLPTNKVWWYKLEPLASSLQSSFQQYYSPSSELSIDELMLRSFCRSQHTYKMPHKPIKQGFKIYGIADHGYIYNFI